SGARPLELIDRADKHICTVGIHVQSRMATASACFSLLRQALWQRSPVLLRIAIIVSGERPKPSRGLRRAMAGEIGCGRHLASTGVVFVCAPCGETNGR